MKAVASGVLELLAIVSWLAGVVLAQGFWSTAAAVCIPFYSWYLLVELAMRKVGWL